MRTRYGAACGEDERGSGTCQAREEERPRAHAFTHAYMHVLARRRTHSTFPPTYARGWWGGKWLPFGLTALLPEKVARSFLPLRIMMGNKKKSVSFQNINLMCPNIFIHIHRHNPRLFEAVDR